MKLAVSVQSTVEAVVTIRHADCLIADDFNGRQQHQSGPHTVAIIQPTTFLPLT